MESCPRGGQLPIIVLLYSWRSLKKIKIKKSLPWWYMQPLQNCSSNVIKLEQRNEKTKQNGKTKIETKRKSENEKEKTEIKNGKSETPEMIIGNRK